jgi:flagellin-like hook-associated protein FlgL
MHELLVIVSNESKFNRAIRNADQAELEKLINQINKVANETSYGHHSLLDGSQGVRGVATGEFLEFVRMNPDSTTSPLSGYEVLITEVASRSELRGIHPLTQAGG